MSTTSRTKYFAILILVALFSRATWAWPGEGESANGEASSEKPGLNRTLLLGGISAGMLGAVLGVGAWAWWGDGGYTGWGWKNDTGFFHEDSEYGGTDKLGHAYACYVSVRAATQIYEWFRVPHRNAVLLGGGLTFLWANAVEVIDGFTPYGFEWRDVVANTAGICFGVASELIPEFDELLGFRITYVPSQDMLDESDGFPDIVNDYSGMNFYLDFKLSGLEEVFNINLGKARYLNFGVAYSTYGYAPEKNAKERNLGVCLSLNVSTLISDTMNTDKKVVRFLRAFTRYYAPPGTTAAVFHDLNDGNTRLNFGVPNRAQVDLN